MKWELNIGDKIEAATGFVSKAFHTVFLSPPRYVWGLAGLAVTAGSIAAFVQNRWVESTPNEWLLVISGGKLVKSGVGLKTYVSITDSYVKFPSKVQQVQFKANNVTKQMQGVIITGFAFWSVYRNEDGPFRCYKYMQGGDANANVQAMCQSALRNLIANSTLDEVLRNRDHLRDNMKKELMDQFKGWGVWLQTVEITEVTISSNKLFKDLQAEFRQEAQLKAQRIELNSNQEITKVKQASEMKMAETTELNETRKQTTRNNERIKRDQQQATYDVRKNQLEVERIQRQTQFEVEKLKSTLKEQQQRIKNEQEIAKKKQDFDIEASRKVLQMDKLHDAKTIQKYQIDATERIYNRLAVKEIKVNQFGGAENKNSLGSILPQLTNQ